MGGWVRCGVLKYSYNRSKMQPDNIICGTPRAILLFYPQNNCFPCGQTIFSEGRFVSDKNCRQYCVILILEGFKCKGFIYTIGMNLLTGLVSLWVYLSNHFQLKIRLSPRFGLNQDASTEGHYPPCALIYNHESQPIPHRYPNPVLLFVNVIDSIVILSSHKFTHKGHDRKAQKETILDSSKILLSQDNYTFRTLQPHHFQLVFQLIRTAFMNGQPLVNAFYRNYPPDNINELQNMHQVWKQLIVVLLESKLSVGCFDTNNNDD